MKRPDPRQAEFGADGFGIGAFNLVGQRITLAPERPAPEVPAILRGYSDAPRDRRPDVDDMSAAELRAELVACGYDDVALDRLNNWPALADAVRRMRRK